MSAPQYEIIRKLTNQIVGLETKQSLVNNGTFSFCLKYSDLNLASEIDSIKSLLKEGFRLDKYRFHIIEGTQLGGSFERGVSGTNQLA